MRSFGPLHRPGTRRSSTEMVDHATALLTAALLHISVGAGVWTVLRTRAGHSHGLWASGELLNGAGLVALVASDGSWSIPRAGAYLALIGSFLLRGLALQYGSGARRRRIEASFVWLLLSAVFATAYLYAPSEVVPRLVAIFAQCIGAAWITWSAAARHFHTGARGGRILAAVSGTLALVLFVHMSVVAYLHQVPVLDARPFLMLVLLADLLLTPLANLAYVELVIETAPAAKVDRHATAESGPGNEKQAPSTEEQAQPSGGGHETLVTLAHEVRHPLAQAGRALRSLGRALPVDRMQAIAAIHLRRATEALARVDIVIENTLTDAIVLGAEDLAPRHDTDIETLVALAIGDLDPSETARIEVRRETATRTASMNSGLVRLSLRNLLWNALEHSPPETPVILRIAECDEPLAVILEVSDHGPGIPNELLPHVFLRGVCEERQSNKEAHGLGLYIVRRVAEKHGGWVEVVATGARGTSIRMSIPQAIAS